MCVVKVQAITVLFLLNGLSADDSKNWDNDYPVIANVSPQPAPHNGQHCNFTDQQPDPIDCSKFLMCSNNRLSIMQCPGTLLFNYAIQACDWPENVDCKQTTSSTTTTPATTTTTTYNVCKSPGTKTNPGDPKHSYIDW